MLETERYLDSTMESELRQAGLDLPDDPDPPSADDPFGGPRFGYATVKLTRLPELPDTIIVTAGVSIPCGVEDAVYVYRFDAEGRHRVVEDHPAGGHGDVAIELAPPDSQGRRLLLLHRLTQQCSSTWMSTAYAVYRVPFLSGPLERLLSVQHEFWWNDQYPIFVLKPDELIVEFLAASVDGSVHNRTYIQRYSFAQGARRLDPVAFQPQDFVEEWLTKPWSEMQSRSISETEAWHSKHHKDFALGDYIDVVPCAELPNRWVTGLKINYLPEKLDTPIEAWFVVRDLGNYHYQMESVTDARPKQCPGLNGSAPLDKHPWLSADKLRALQGQ
jgi:hypothetical protein